MPFTPEESRAQNSLNDVAGNICQTLGSGEKGSGAAKENEGAGGGREAREAGPWANRREAYITTSNHMIRENTTGTMSNWEGSVGREFKPVARLNEPLHVLVTCVPAAYRLRTISVPVVCRPLHVVSNANL
jgi:hypothetical protein